jgi:hypothetical protein
MGNAGLARKAGKEVSSKKYGVSSNYSWQVKGKLHRYMTSSLPDLPGFIARESGNMVATNGSSIYNNRSKLTIKILR